MARAATSSSLLPGITSDSLASPLLPAFDVSLGALTGAQALNLHGQSATISLLGICNSVAAGDAPESVSGGNGLSTVMLGDGHDTVTLGGCLNTVVLGNGSDTVIAGTAQATLAVSADAIELSDGPYLDATLGISLAAALSGGTRSGNIGWFDAGTGNIGSFDGWGNADGSDGNDNIGVLDGNDNGGTLDGCKNVGVLNGNLCGLNDAQPGGYRDGNRNTGLLNGNLDGDGNAGRYDGHNDGNNDRGVLNGVLDGNSNTGNNNGNADGNFDLGSLNGVADGNGAPLAFESANGPFSLASIEGSLDTIVLGNGRDYVTDPGGLATIVAGSGKDTFDLGGVLNTVVATGADTVRGAISFSVLQLGDGGDRVLLTGDGGNVIATGAGDDTIQIAGRGNWVDAGAAATFNTISGGSGGNTYVLPDPGHGYDRISGFALGVGDKLDLSCALAASGWDGRAADLASWLHVSAGAADTSIAVGAGSGRLVAELVGIQTTYAALQQDKALLLG